MYQMQAPESVSQSISSLLVEQARQPVAHQRQVQCQPHNQSLFCWWNRPDSLLLNICDRA
ncbi:hypothetical protein IQ252_17715 [Tychonema sp. LEGE 07203]|nr:hypothetical protein [Tychonema sp. LEGE 07203]